MKTDWPQHYALTVVLEFTGMRFFHASALKWEDVDEDDGVLRIRRKQRMGTVGPVSRKKRAPRELPVEPPVVEILREHRQRLVAEQAPGLAEGWMFPSADGTLRQPSSVYKAWTACSKAAGVRGRFTVHGLRYTFNDLTRRAGVNGLVTRSLAGHVTEDMTQHYSTIGMDEKRAAVASVLRLVPMTPEPTSTGEGGTSGGTSALRSEAAPSGAS